LLHTKDDRIVKALTNAGQRKISLRVPRQTALLELHRPEIFPQPPQRTSVVPFRTPGKGP
jgi:peptidyl-tRNA hydrolase